MSSVKSAERLMDANVRVVAEQWRFMRDLPMVWAGVMAFNMLAG